MPSTDRYRPSRKLSWDRLRELLWLKGEAVPRDQQPAVFECGQRENRGWVQQVGIETGVHRAVGKPAAKVAGDHCAVSGEDCLIARRPTGTVAIGGVERAIEIQDRHTRTRDAIDCPEISGHEDLAIRKLLNLGDGFDVRIEI